MDFLEIRRKAKERAAARAAEARGELKLEPVPVPKEPTPPAPPDRPSHVKARPAQPRPADRPAPESRPPPPALAPVPAPVPAPAVAGAAVAPAEPARVRRGPAPGSPEALRMEAELAARLATLPHAADPRFVTWRPEGGPLPDYDEAPASAEPAVIREAPRSPASLDPLDDFFFRPDERAPELADLPSAAPEAPAVEAVERDEYLTFRLAGDEYGVAIGRVSEVMRSALITEVPRAPADVLGVITVRGEVVAVFDPRRRLGLPPGRPPGGGRMVIVDDGLGACGLLVDAVVSVVRLPRGVLEPCPQGIGTAGADAMVGIGRDADRLFTVLEVGALLRPLRRAAEARSA